MKKSFTRRDFLRIAGLFPIGLIAPPLIHKLHAASNLQSEKRNVLVVVFDAFSAYDISLYGYGRPTTPNLSRLAKRAYVYHNHFSGGNFTTPGTASLLTMTFPWTHRAIRFGAHVRDDYADKSVFHAFDDYYRLGYTHNPLANALLIQFKQDINGYIPREKLFINNDGLITGLFVNDEDISTVAWTREIKTVESGYSYSLFLSHLYEKIQQDKIASYKADYPEGVPSSLTDNYFTLEDGITWLEKQAPQLPQPFFAYTHFLPPHFPYKPRKEFYNHFTNDAFKPLDKPQDPFFTEGNAYETLAKSRAHYDQYILNVDSEFGRLFDSLEKSGILDNTWVVLTSDHGEMQERGISGHTTSTLYQPIVRVPLMIFEPGQKTHRDVYTPTSAVDVMTTVLQLTGHPFPEWSEGTLLPPFNPGYTPSSGHVFTVQARANDPALPLTEATIMHVEDNYKLIYYLGYEELGGEAERFQLFDIKSDPEELSDISNLKKETASEMLALVKSKLKDVNLPFQPH